MKSNISKNYLEKITVFSFYLLAIFPLLKENFISITMIFSAILIILNLIRNKKPIKITRAFFYVTTVFWLVLLRELIFFELTTQIIVFHLSFLIIPLLFYFKPKYINSEVQHKSFVFFQISIFIISIYYLMFFLNKNTVSQLFYISNENIPFFRNFVTSKSFFTIHPTYFSTYLLISFTLSFIEILKNIKNKNLFHIINIVSSVFFIFVFSSKIIIINLAISIVLILIYFINKIKLKNLVTVLAVVLLTIISISLTFDTLIKERFNEIKTEINKPIEGKYYNSINIRVAIIKCSLDLIKKSPPLGYGYKTQEKLTDCYRQNHKKSDFYLKNSYNTHNYYINLILYGGWALLIVFLIYIGYLAYNIKYSYLAIIILFQILLINFTENFLSRQFGVMTFNYFMMSFFFIKSKKNNARPITVQTTQKL